MRGDNGDGGSRHREELYSALKPQRHGVPSHREAFHGGALPQHEAVGASARLLWVSGAPSLLPVGATTAGTGRENRVVG